MFLGLLHLHSALRWVVLGLLLLSIIKAYQGKSATKIYAERKLNLFTVLAFHLQVVLGFAMYGMSGFVKSGLHTEGFMKFADLRFWVVEHPVGMVLAAIILTIGNAKSKCKSSDLIKHKTIFTYFLIALIIIIATIPWPFREAIGRNWFSFM